MSGVSINEGRGPWTLFKVVDAIGEEFLHTGSFADYEPAFRKHAAWWIRHRTRPGAHRDTDALGRMLKQPVKPCRIVIESVE